MRGSSPRAGGVLQGPGVAALCKLIEAEFVRHALYRALVRIGIIGAAKR